MGAWICLFNAYRPSSGNKRIYCLTFSERIHKLTLWMGLFTLYRTEMEGTPPWMRTHSHIHTNTDFHPNTDPNTHVICQWHCVWWGETTSLNMVHWRCTETGPGERTKNTKSASFLALIIYQVGVRTHRHYTLIIIRVHALSFRVHAEMRWLQCRG